MNAPGTIDKKFGVIARLVVCTRESDRLRSYSSCNASWDAQADAYSNWTASDRDPRVEIPTSGVSSAIDTQDYRHRSLYSA